MNKLFLLLVVSIWIRHKVAASNFHHDSQDVASYIDDKREMHSQQNSAKRETQESEELTAEDVEIGIGKTTGNTIFIPRNASKCMEEKKLGCHVFTLIVHQQCNTL